MPRCEWAEKHQSAVVGMGGPLGKTKKVYAFQAAIPSFCFASRSASGRAFHAVICEFVLLPRNTARNVLFALMRFPFLYVLRVQTKAQKRCFTSMNSMAIFIMGSCVLSAWL